MNRVVVGVLQFITLLLCGSSIDAFTTVHNIGGVSCCFDAVHRHHPPQQQLTIMSMTPAPTTKTTDGGQQQQLPPGSKRQRLLEIIRRFRSLLDDEVWSKHNVSPMQVVRDTHEQQIIKRAVFHQELEEEGLMAVNVDQFSPSPDTNNNRGTLLDNVPDEQHVAQIMEKMINTTAPPTTNDDTATTTMTTTTSRQTESATHVDLSGIWKPIVTEQFKKEYDAYLTNCSQPYLFRKLLVNGIVFQKEHIRQLNDGSHLEIIATNPAGNWNRTLITSSSSSSTISIDNNTHTPPPYNNDNVVTISDPDGDIVYIEAYWIDDGTKHKSILRGKPNVEGGYFETVRYLEKQRGSSSSSSSSGNNNNNNNDMREEDVLLICESKFYPPLTWQSNSKEFNYGQVVWRFKRSDQ